MSSVVGEMNTFFTALRKLVGGRHIGVHMCLNIINRCTLSGDNEAGHTVGDTGACCQESDTHDHLWDSKRVADNSHLDRNTKEAGWVYVDRCNKLMCRSAAEFHTIQTMR